MIFTESIVSNSTVEAKVQGLSHIVGIVDPGNALNPYHGSVSAKMVHYISYNKPKSIFTKSDGIYQLCIPVELLKEILSFIQTYCGVDCECQSKSEPCANLILSYFT